MLYRQKFITNSSSVAFLAFGISVDKKRFQELENSLPMELDYQWTPWDNVYVHIGFPKIGLDEEGNLILPPKDCLQEKYLVLKKWIKDNEIEDDRIGYIHEGWTDN